MLQTFLGYALIQIPGMIRSLYVWIQNNSLDNLDLDNLDQSVKPYKKKVYHLNDPSMSKQVETSIKFKIEKEQGKFWTNYPTRPDYGK